jgi:hypothetical protein
MKGSKINDLWYATLIDEGTKWGLAKALFLWIMELWLVNLISEVVMGSIKIENFRWDGMYLMYLPDPMNPRNAVFVARFKYRSKPWKSWAKFMVKNFSSIEEYAAEERDSSPLKVMESRGYVSPAKKKAIKMGYI